MTIESLQFRNMRFEYDQGAQVFADVTFDLPVGENVLITSQSGEGKTALLKMLGGLLMPSSGEYLINGQNITEMSFEEFLPWRKRIGFSFDYGGLLANRTLWDNLMLPLQYHSVLPFDEAAQRVRDLVRCFGIEAVKDRRPSAVSGGMRKACVLARSFVMEPEMLILDDPFVGLDREVVTRLLDLIQKSRSHGRLKHVFFTSRGEAVSFKLGTRYLLIEDGSLRLDDLAGSRDERKVGNR